MAKNLKLGERVRVYFNIDHNTSQIMDGTVIEEGGGHAQHSSRRCVRIQLDRNPADMKFRRYAYEKQCVRLKRRNSV